MESQFVLAGITTDTTKYHHILAAIPEDVAINFPMEIEDYSSLKDSITQVCQKSKTKLIEEALETISLAGLKPSICLLRIQRKLSECHLTMENDVIKHRLMQAMPVSTRSSLSAHLDLPPDKFAKLADTIYSYSKDTFPTSTRHVLTIPLIASPFRLNLIFVRLGSFVLKSYLSPNLLSTKCNA